MGVVKRGFCQRASEQPNQLTRVGCTNPKPLSPAGKGRLFCQRLVSELRPIRSTDKDFTQPARTLILLLRHVLFNVFTEGVINLGKSLYDFIRQALGINLIWSMGGNYNVFFNYFFWHMFLT